MMTARHRGFYVWWFLVSSMECSSHLYSVKFPTGSSRHSTLFESKFENDKDRDVCLRGTCVSTYGRVFDFGKFCREI